MTNTPATDPNFNEKLENHRKVIRQHCYRLTKHTEDAKDLTQETMLKAYKNRALYNPKWALSTWLTAIATKLFLDLKRYRSRRIAPLSLDAPLPGYSDSVYYDAPDTSPTVPNLDNEDAVRRLIDSVLEPGTRYNEVALQGIMKGHDHKEASEELNVKPAIVRSRTFRAHDMLRKELKKNPLLLEEAGICCLS